jgi:hypothetical protein
MFHMNQVDPIQRYCIYKGFLVEKLALKHQVLINLNFIGFIALLSENFFRLNLNLEDIT